MPLLSRVQPLAAVLLILLAARAAFGQPGPMPEHTLPDTLVVTASRLPEDVRLSGRRVAVWTARDLAALPVSSVDELLRAVGGVEVQSRGGFGVQSDLTMRGSTFNGVLLLLDGARINDPMTGHFLADLPVPLSEIARVEVVRGPATALYGPDALGGVIQLFTYEGLREAEAPPRRLGGAAGLDRGRHGLYDYALALRGTAARTTLSAATAWLGADGETITGTSGAPVLYPAGDPVRTDFTRRVHTAALAHPVGPALLFVRAGADARGFSAWHYYSPLGSDFAREETSTLWAQARLSRSTGRLPWQVQVAAKQHEDAYVFNPSTPANEHTSRMLHGQGHLTAPLAPQLTLTTGASGLLRGIESNNMGAHDDASAGAFALARWRPLAHLALSAGGRLDYDPSYRWAATPQLGAAYSRGIVSAYVSTGRAVRAPNYIERYFNTTLARPRGRDLGYPDLDVETAWTHEAGLSLYPASGLSLHAAAFTRRTADLIDFARTTAADTVFLARNLHEVRTDGLELDADFVHTLGRSRTRLALSYALLGTSLDSLGRDVQFKYALTSARHLLQGMAALDFGAASLGLQGLYKDPLPADRRPYGVLNLLVGYHLNLGRQRLALRGEIRNLLDEPYSDVFDAPMPRRWWIAGLRLTR